MVSPRGVLKANRVPSPQWVLNLSVALWEACLFASPCSLLPRLLSRYFSLPTPSLIISHSSKTLTKTGVCLLYPKGLCQATEWERPVSRFCPKAEWLPWGIWICQQLCEWRLPEVFRSIWKGGVLGTCFFFFFFRILKSCLCISVRRRTPWCRKQKKDSLPLTLMPRCLLPQGLQWSQRPGLARERVGSLSPSLMGKWPRNGFAVWKVILTTASDGNHAIWTRFKSVCWHICVLLPMDVHSSLVESS